MTNPTYVSLTRQSGLLQELQVLANNLANSSTAGFRREGVIFTEHVEALEGGDDSVSMALAEARVIDRTQGQLSQTGGKFDFAVEGEGYFVIETPEGEQLTRAGIFGPNAEGELVTAEGHRLLDAGGAAIFVPPDATTIMLAKDGTLSADDQIIADVGLYRPVDPIDLNRVTGVRFSFEGEIEPVEDPTILQGFQESSNVDPVLEVARLIEVQRAYEQGSKLLAAEDQRIQSVIDTLGK